VIGALEDNGQQDDVAVIPITTVRNYLVGGGADDIVDRHSSRAAPRATARQLSVHRA
jgi:hypothetical protein